MAINKRIVAQHLRLGRLVLGLWLFVVPALDLRLLQLPRGRGNHRQDEEEGQDRQVELIHHRTGEVGVVGREGRERRLGRRERCATVGGMGSCGLIVPPGGAGADQAGPFK